MALQCSDLAFALCNQFGRSSRLLADFLPRNSTDFFLQGTRKIRHEVGQLPGSGWPNIELVREKPCCSGTKFRERYGRSMHTNNEMIPRIIRLEALGYYILYHNQYRNHRWRLAVMLQVPNCWPFRAGRYPEVGVRGLAGRSAHAIDNGRLGVRMHEAKNTCRRHQQQSCKEADNHPRMPIVQTQYVLDRKPAGASLRVGA